VYNGNIHIAKSSPLHSKYKYIQYDELLRNKELLKDLAKLSVDMSKTLEDILTYRLFFSKVKDITPDTIEHIFDLSMQTNTSDIPAFSANGIITHNSKNAFALVTAHKSPTDNNTIITDVVAEVIPLPGIPVNHTKLLEDMIYPIIERQNVVMVTADRWNSLKLLSDIEADFSIVTKQYSLKYRDFFTFKVLMEQGLLVLPRPVLEIEDIMETSPSDYPSKFLTKPTDHLILQCLTVQDSGTHILKGDGNLNDDIFRSLVLACHMITQSEYDQLFLRRIQEDSKQQAMIYKKAGGIDRPNSAMLPSAKYGTLNKGLGISLTRR
jgi:predicted transcriptional regulator